MCLFFLINAPVSWRKTMLWIGSGNYLQKCSWLNSLGFTVNPEPDNGLARQLFVLAGYFQPNSCTVSLSASYHGRHSPFWHTDTSMVCVSVCVFVCARTVATSPNYFNVYMHLCIFVWIYFHCLHVFCLRRKWKWWGPITPFFLFAPLVSRESQRERRAHEKAQVPWDGSDGRLSFVRLFAPCLSLSLISCWG